MFLPPLVPLVAAYLCSDPYCRSRVDTHIANDPKAHCLYWETPKITFVQNDVGDPSLPDKGFPAVSKSWASWEAVAASCGSSLRITEGPKSASRTIGYDPNATNENLLLFRQKYCDDIVPATDPCRNADRKDCNNVYDCWFWLSGTIALTTTTYDTQSGIIYDADIELNSSKFFFTDVDSPPCVGVPNPSCVSTDIQNTVTHESGHAIGLDHNTSDASTMYNQAPPGEISKRTIDPGSIRYVCEVYRDAGPPEDCVILAMPLALGTTAQGCGGCSVGLGPALGLAVLLVLGRRAR